MTAPPTAHPAGAHAPTEARRRAPQLRQGRRGCAGGVRRARRVDLAGGDRAPRRGRDRDAVPQLPEPPGPARGGVRRRGREPMPLRGRARRTSRRGTRSSPGCTAWSAIWPPSRRSRTSCSSISTETRRSSRPAAPRSSPPASQCSTAPSRPESVRADTDLWEIIQMVGGIAKIPSADPSRSSTSSTIASTACATGHRRIASQGSLASRGVVGVGRTACHDRGVRRSRGS